jgi:magnesium transporter
VIGTAVEESAKDSNWAVSVALLCACCIASVVAMALPWLLRLLRQDPAFAAGPLATVIQDLLSVLVYLVVCLALI